jgi:hypothetical protein
MPDIRLLVLDLPKWLSEPRIGASNSLLVPNCPLLVADSTVCEDQIFSVGFCKLHRTSIVTKRTAAVPIISHTHIFFSLTALTFLTDCVGSTDRSSMGYLSQ